MTRKQAKDVVPGERLFVTWQNGEVLPRFEPVGRFHMDTNGELRFHREGDDRYVGRFSPEMEVLVD